MNLLNLERKNEGGKECLAHFEDHPEWIHFLQSSNFLLPSYPQLQYNQDNLSLPLLQDSPGLASVARR